MAYPNEISRSTKATASGTSYTEVAVYPYGVQDRALVCIPTEVADGANSTVVVCAHGSGGSEETINSVMMETTRDACLDAGWIVASAFAHDRAWGNDTAIADYTRLHQWVNDTWPVTHALLHGQSMGGLTVMLMASRGDIPNVRATVSIDGALNLAQAFSQSTYGAQIRAAYGIASNGSDYASKTAGHDAVLLTPATFAGQRLFLSASPNDANIPKGSHSDLFHSNMLGQPEVFTYRTGTGAHVSAANYFPTDVFDFYSDAIAAAAPEPVPADAVVSTWNGTAWVPAPVTYWNGSDWVPAPVTIFA